MGFWARLEDWMNERPVLSSLVFAAVAVLIGLVVIFLR